MTRPVPVLRPPSPWLAPGGGAGRGAGGVRERPGNPRAPAATTRRPPTTATAATPVALPGAVGAIDIVGTEYVFELDA